MIGLILAAGKGSRLGKLTESTPKSMLKLNDKDTLMSYNLKSLAKLGVSKVVLVTGFRQEQCTKYAENICRDQGLQLDVVYNPFWNSCNVLGSLYMALDSIDDDFIFMHADTLLELGAIKMLQDSPAETVLSVDKKACGEEEMKVVLEGNAVTHISKEIASDQAHGEFVGVAKFNKSMVSYFKQTAKHLFSSGDTHQYMEAVLQYAIETGERPISYIDTSEYKSIEVDFEGDLQEARRLFA